MKYISTRGQDQIKGSYNAILKGLANDGGLYVPEKFSNLDLEKLLNLKSYREVAAYTIGCVFQDIEKDELLNMTTKAYDQKFSKPEVLPLQQVDDNIIMELFYGQTAAFKDFALSILPLFMQQAMDDREVIILTATSGDTGKAALEGFKDVEKTHIFVYYPTDGVSSMQKRQMCTQQGKNTHAIGIKGNFDDAQRNVKNIFSSSEMNKWAKDHGYVLSSANSINIGRLVPQIAYYVYTYIEMVKREDIVLGDTINVSVPTGNFGDILAAYYAKKMGLPINRLICASNRNNVLTDFFETGYYNANRPLYMTTSPSMDILVSSNLERLLFDVSECGAQVAEWMNDLKDKGEFQVEPSIYKRLSDFKAYYTTEEETAKTIEKVYREHNYLLDTHTAAAYLSAMRYKEETQDYRKMVVVSTASPYKFPEAVSSALGLNSELNSEELVKNLYIKTGVEVPRALSDLWTLEITQDEIIEVEAMESTIKERLL